jgi:hypothetical protein
VLTYSIHLRTKTGLLTLLDLHRPRRYRLRLHLLLQLLHLHL